MKNLLPLALAFGLSVSCSTNPKTAEHHRRQPASAVSCESIFNDSEELISRSDREGYLQRALQPRARLLSVYLKANQKFPQNSGTRVVGFAMATEIIRDPKSIEALGAQLTRPEIEEIGESINKTHAAFGIPVRYSSNGLSSPTHASGTVLVGPDRIQALYTGFSSLALNTLLGRIHSIKKSYNVDQQPFDFSKGEEWENLKIKANSNDPRDLAEGRNAVREFFTNPATAEDVQIMERLGKSMEAVLNSDDMKRVAKDKREKLRCPVGGRYERKAQTPQEERELVNVFESALMKQVTADFPDFSKFRQRNLWQQP